MASHHPSVAASAAGWGTRRGRVDPPGDSFSCGRIRSSVRIISYTARGTRFSRRWTHPVSRTSCVPAIRAQNSVPALTSRATA